MIFILYSIGAKVRLTCPGVKHSNLGERIKACWVVLTMPVYVYSCDSTSSKHLWSLMAAIYRGTIAWTLSLVCME